ncbi:YHS domain-containing (seleno)protein [Breoghania corrubedonensis]|uniref:YHS domain-containing (seleno)protein n=1 Tax=Breoghania corrubedonensis TaxID=665038 RepID=UPI000D3B0867|nr:YHS domain-containing (seleno)protein [Breoghania corrubedonensis]
MPVVIAICGFWLAAGGLVTVSAAPGVRAAEAAIGAVAQVTTTPAQEADGKSDGETARKPANTGDTDTGDAEGKGAGHTIPQRYVLVDPATGLAIGGYDPVAYFVDRRPRLGKPRFEFVWSRTIWRFVNEGNLAAFKDAPQVYAPQFGGHDASALAEDRLSPGDPRVWAIYHQRLYLFYSPARRFSWLVAPDSYLRRANESWDKRINFKIRIDMRP